MRRICASVLVLEAIVVVLALPVALVLYGASSVAAGTWAGVLIVGLVASSALLRHTWAYIVGSVLQLVCVAFGAIVPPMYFLGVIFAILWVVALWLGSQGEAVGSR